MAALDDAIDSLYRLPLDEFTAARNALAKTLAGSEKARVKALPKPTLVPWAVNQVYWTARPAYDKVMKTGAALRLAQLDALEGRQGKVAKAQEAHRDALRDATTRALAAGAKHGSQPPAEPVSRMLEALSLAATPPEHPGRLIEIVQPSGFEALAGLSPERIVGSAIRLKPDATGVSGKPDAKSMASGISVASGTSVASGFSRIAADADGSHASRQPTAKELAQQRARAEASVRIAEQALVRSQDREAAAEQTLAALRQRIADAEQSLTTARATVAEAEERLRTAQADLTALEPAKASRTRPAGRV